jgi:hypothetical protein
MSLIHRLGIHQAAMGHSCIEFIPSQGLMVCYICGREEPVPHKVAVPKGPVVSRCFHGRVDYVGKLQ